MKHFSICLIMLLLLVLGKHNGARLYPAAALAQRPAPPLKATKHQTPAGAGRRMATLMTLLVR